MAGEFVIVNKNLVKMLTNYHHAEEKKDVLFMVVNFFMNIK
jgi:hypothetical protein